MYTLFQRKKAIKLYIKFGFRSAFVISMLGYPERRTLRVWYKEYISNGNKHINTLEILFILTKKEI